MFDSNDYMTPEKIKRVVGCLKKDIKASIQWNRNRITGKTDDPHKNTMQEGFYASLCIKAEDTEISLSMPEFLYDLNSVQILKDVIDIINKGE
jgi:hypothetical protein